MTLSVVESGHEPELFKSVFKNGWVHYDHSVLKGIEESDEEEENGGEKKVSRIPMIIAENIWID
jgi:hypothetical protein